MDNNGWVDETLPLRMLHSMRDGMWRGRRKQGVNISPIAEEPVLPHAAFAAATSPPEAPPTVEPTVEALPALAMTDDRLVVPATEPTWAPEPIPVSASVASNLIEQTARPVRAAEPRRHRRRPLAKVGLVASTVVAMVGGTAGVAFANAANPLPTSTGTATLSPNGVITQNADGSFTITQGTVTVNLNGDWSWAAISGASAQAGCDSRYGVGWAVAWNGLVPAGSAPGWNIKSTNLEFPTGSTMDGVWRFAAPPTGQGCQVNNTTQNNPIGTWSASHTYSTGSTIPADVCVNMYDLHGHPDAISNVSDLDPTHNGDNSVAKNDFNPTVGHDFCFHPALTNNEQLSAQILNCATGAPQNGGSLSATGPQTIGTTQDQLASTNVKSGTYEVDALTAPSGFQFVPCPGQPAGNGTVTASGSTAKATGVNVAPGGSATVKFYVSPVGQTLAAQILNCATGAPQNGGTLSASGPQTIGTTQNQLPATSVASGIYSVNANAPSGFQFVSCPGQSAGNGTVTPSAAGDTATASNVNVPQGQSATVKFYVSPLTQSITGNIVNCQTNSEDASGTGRLRATGPNNESVASQANPINGAPVQNAGSWTMFATAPTGTQFVTACGQTGNGTSTSQTKTVPAGGSQTFTFFVTPNPNTPTLSLTKTANVSTVTAPGSFNWTLVAHNAGPGDATHAVVTDTIPNGLTINGTPSTTQGSCSVSGQNVSCPLGTLAANTSATIVINVTANGTVCGPITNTGVLTTDQGTTQGSATVTVNCPNFNINLTKSASVGNNATITAGTSFTYTLVATNTGGAAATGVVVTDAIPSQLTINGTPTSTQGTCSTSGNNVTCNVGTLAANGGAATVTINVGTSTSSCGVVNNMGQVTATGGTTGNSNTVTTTIACAETVGITVGVVKTNNAQDPTGTDYGKTETAQTLGETFNYQAVITNTSPVTEVIGTITDTIAGQPIQDVCASLVGQTLAPQASLTCTFQGVAPNANGGSITDTVTVPVSQQGTPTNTGTGTDTSTVNTPPGVIITKSSNAAGTGFGQNETVAKGSTSVPYQVTVTNPNSSPGTITSLTDTIDGTTTNICPDLIGKVLAPSGQADDSVVCNFTTSVPTSVTTDTAAVNLSVNGVVVPGSAQTTVFPPVLGTQITPAPATLAFTGAPIGKLLASALGMIAMGLLLLFGLQVIDTRRRPSLRFAVAERGRRAGPVPTAPPVPTREPTVWKAGNGSAWKAGNGYEQTATAAAVTWLADRVRSSFLHLRR